MYSQNELDEAVAAGAISRDAAASLRAFIEQQRTISVADEEQFRLLTGFNDIFVAIAAAILLFAVGWIGQWLGQAAGLAISTRTELSGSTNSATISSRVNSSSTSDFSTGVPP